MAHMPQEKKSQIAAALKLAIPKTWKYSLAVRHSSTLVLTITAAPVDLMGDLKAQSAKRARFHGDADYIANAHYLQLNTHSRDEAFANPETRATFERILAALNDGNFDKSDVMTDYFHVGWYVDVNIGRFGRPFVCTDAVDLQVAA